jgi:hypothetical protein
MLLWTIDETSGFDTTWAKVEGRRLQAAGRVVALSPRPHWLDYALETGVDFVHQRVSVTSRGQGRSASLDLRRDGDGRWSANGERRPDLDDALDCDLAACPLTNTMPVLRHDLHRAAGDRTFLMAFIEVPSLKVVTSRQRYTHLRRTQDGGAVIRYASGSFRSDLTVDTNGFVVDYPHLGRRVRAGESAPEIRARPGSLRPDGGDVAP